jgi:hypothetical protein
MNQNRKIQGLYFVAIWLFFFMASCEDSAREITEKTVEVRYENGRATLYRNGLPYHIKGGSGTQHLDKVALYGGNSIRTWNTDNARELLDEAQSLGLTVTLGLTIGRPYWGEDFNYWNLFAVDRKIEELRPTIEEFKDHPALLMWGVGNEVALAGGQRDVVYYVINRVAKMVKEVDPNHPVITATTGQIIGRVQYLMPDIDILGYNAFGSIEEFYNQTKNYLEDDGWGRAYIFTEWGPPGHWEVAQTEWGAPLEQNTDEKLLNLDKYWKLMNQDSMAFLGSYAFYWGSKYEITHTWFSYFSGDGLESELVNFIKSAWSGEKFERLAPRITGIKINDKVPEINLYLYSDSAYSASTYIDLLENDVPNATDSLTYKWEIRPEESKFHEVSAYHYNMNALLKDEKAELLKFNAPKHEGAYRLFVFVSNNKGYFNSYNVPFYVLSK